MFGPFKQLSPPAKGPSAVALALGLSAGAAAYLVWRRRSRRREVEWLPDGLAQLEQDAVTALSDDERIGHRGIDVAAVGQGIIELTGDVENIEEAHHAVDIAQGVEGVHTVINRLTLIEPERHFAETRQRFFAGDAALSETHWEGMNVGMGRRRQSEDTDPARPDDHVQAVSRALEPDAPDSYTEPAEDVEADRIAESPEQGEPYGAEGTGEGEDDIAV